MAYHFTAQTEEAQAREGDSMFAIKRQFEFDLQKQKQADSLQTFRLVIKRISDTRPATSVVRGKNGGMMVRPTGGFITRQTDGDVLSDKSDYWYALLHLVNDSVKIILNTRGEVYNSSGYETIRDKIIERTGADARSISPLLREYIGPDALSDLMKNLFFYLPAKIIKPGDQWVNTIELTQKAPVKYSHNISVRSIDGDTVHLSVQTIVSARLGGGKLIVEGELAGTVAASLSSGMPFNIDLTERSVTHTDSYDVKKKLVFRVTLHQSPAR